MYFILAAGSCVHDSIGGEHFWLCMTALVVNTFGHGFLKLTINTPKHRWRHEHSFVIFTHCSVDPMHRFHCALLIDANFR